MGINSSRHRKLRKIKKEKVTNENIASVINISEKDAAILKLKRCRDKLEQFKVKNQHEQEIYHNKAKSLLASKRPEEAKLALKLKILRTKKINQLDSQIFNLQELVNDIDWAQQQIVVIEGIKAGNEALKHLNDMLPIEKIEQLIEEKDDLISRQEEITNLLSEIHANLSPEEETSAEVELQTMIQELDPTSLFQTTETTPSLETVKNLPSAPTTLPKLPEPAEKEKVLLPS